MITRYAIAGTGARGFGFAKAIQGPYAEYAALVGLYDSNATRARGFAGLLSRPVPVYTDMRRLRDDCRPDVLIICTPDHSHATLIEMAFRHGMDVVVEKPLAITAAQVARVAALEEEFGRRVQVAFNMRYAAYSARVKQVLLEQDLGEIRSVSLDWYMDQVHGPEYFRRWHRHMAKSGGLLVHKSSHHFDLVNWYLEDAPVEVSGMGSLEVFGRRGPYRGTTCRQCAHARRCPYVMDVSTWGQASQAKNEALYFGAEHEDGYLRDGCVYDNSIDIYDTMSVMARYAGGAQLTYSLVAYGPYEGYRLAITGTKGRLEAGERFGAFLVNGWQTENVITIIRGHKRETVSMDEVRVPVVVGSHGGGDTAMFRHLFVPGVADDLGQHAGLQAGANACLMGIMANAAIASGRSQRIPAYSAHPQVSF